MRSWFKESCLICLQLVQRILSDFVQFGTTLPLAMSGVFVVGCIGELPGVVDDQVC